MKKKQRVLSFLLAMVFVVSTMMIVPFTATAVGNTFNASDASPVITTVADLDAFRTAVRGGNSFAGKTVKLGADIDLANANFESIGAAASYPFAGNFDGQGHTISNFYQEITNGDGDGGFLGFVRVPADGTVTIKNFALIGGTKTKLTNCGYYGCILNGVDAGLSGSGGTVNFENIYVDVYVDCYTKASIFGGFVGWARHQDNLKPLTLNFDGCVSNVNFDLPSAGFSNIGGFLGYTGLNKSGRALTVNFSNSMFTGKLMTNGCGANYMDDLGLFVGFCKTNNSSSDATAKVTFTMKDCISTGSYTGTYLRSSDVGIALGEMSNTPSNGSSATITNLYYVDTKSVPAIGYIGSGMSSTTNVVAKTAAEIQALTSSAFSDGSKWSFGSGRAPYPKYIAENLLVLDPVTTISDADDFERLKKSVAAGTTYSGMTVTLTANVTLPSDWTGIGSSSAPFCGTFDGQGNTVTLASSISESYTGGLFAFIGGNATIQNLKLNGTITAPAGSNDYVYFVGSVVCETKGTVTLRNVYSSVNFDSRRNSEYWGGLVGCMENNTAGGLTIDGCIYDGTMNFGAYADDLGGILGYGGLYSSRTITITNTVFAGRIQTNSNVVYDDIGCFVGYLKNPSSSSNTCTISNCISVGIITYGAESYSKGLNANGIAVGNAQANWTLNISNFYYFDVSSKKLNDGSLPLLGSDASEGTKNGTAKDSSAMAAMSSTAFSDSSKWGFKSKSGTTGYVPCPAYFANTASWLSSLKVTVSADSFDINSLVDLQTLKTNLENGTVDYTGSHWYLKADLTLPTNWDGIGTLSHPFNGIFEGNGHTVTLQSNVTAAKTGAFFKFLGDGAQVLDLCVDGTVNAPNTMKTYPTNESSKGAYLGGIANMAFGTVSLINVRMAAVLSIGNNNRVGGFIGGLAEGDVATIVNFSGCIFDGAIKDGGGAIGGYIGTAGYGERNESTPKIVINFLNCASVGKIGAYEGSNATKDTYSMFVAYPNAGSQVTVNLKNVLEAGTFVTPLHGTEPSNEEGGTFVGNSWDNGNFYYNALANVWSLQDHYDIYYDVADGWIADHYTGFGDETICDGKTWDELEAGGVSLFDENEWLCEGAYIGDHVFALPKYWASRMPCTVTIKTVADLQSVVTKVNGGNKMIDRTFELESDLTLPADWVGIGDPENSIPFCGAFDGNGHTITFANTVTADETGALIRYAGDGAIIKDLKTNGTMTLNPTSGTANYEAVLVNRVAGNVQVENVCCSTNITTTAGSAVMNSGAFVGHLEDYADATVNFTGCVSDGTYTFNDAVTYFGGFLGTTGNVYSSNHKTVNFASCAYAGKMLFNDVDATANGGFIGYVCNNAAATIATTFENNVSVGDFVFKKDLNWSSANCKNGTLIGAVSKSADGNNNASNSAAVTFYYTYYLKVEDYNTTTLSPVYMSDVGLIYNNSRAQQGGSFAGAQTKKGMGNLTSANFTGASKLTFKDNEKFTVYFPKPTCGTWTVFSAELPRCAAESGYRDSNGKTGLHITAEFYDVDNVENIGYYNTNCGVIVIAKKYYDSSLDTAAKIKAAGGVGVKVIMYEELPDDAGYTADVIITGIPESQKNTELVIISFIGNYLSDPVYTTLAIARGN